MTQRPKPAAAPAAFLLATALSLSAQTPATTTIKVYYDQATLHHDGKVLIPVLDNDYDTKGKIDPASLTLVELPKFGSAVPDGKGRVLYTHQTGTPDSDTFKYRVASSTGEIGEATVRVVFGKSLRIPNPTLDVPADPPGTVYQLVDAFPGVAFTLSTSMDSPPGDTKRLFVLEKGGVVRMVPDVAAAAPVAQDFLDLNKLLAGRGEKISTENEQGLLGIAFHPKFTENGRFYLFYSVILADGIRCERVSCFTVKDGRADPASELVLLQQIDQAPNHQGSCLRFGPDGYLYISLGDEGGQNDQFDNTQRIDKNFFSGILRIDVDKKPGSLPPNPHPSIPTDAGVARYSVPPDNPFIHQRQGGAWEGVHNGVRLADPAKVRTEFWATGLRNPWQMHFDPATGDLWVGDVGGGTREEINIVTRGGNYGWPYREGFTNGPKKPRSGETDFQPTDPLFDYTRGTGTGQGVSVTGGLVYQGARLPALAGSYIFADYASGNLWSLRRKSAGPPIATRIAGEAGISSFGTDPSNGDLLMTDHNDKRLLRLVAGKPGSGFPGKLSATHLFISTADLSPAPGVLPYAINHPAWSDGATSRHWIVIPDEKSRMDWSLSGNWNLPAGTIWIQQLDLGGRRIETRLLVKNDAGAYGVSYRWDADQQDATLVAEAGEDLTIDSAPPRRWHIPSQSECMICHTRQAGYALSFNTRQLNTASIHPAFPGNQLDLLAKHGFLVGNVGSADTLPKFVPLESNSVALDERARSYLAVNCANCHQPGGLAPTAWDLRPEVPLAETGILTAVGLNSGGDPANKPIVPGDPAHSLILHRMAAANGFQRMPLLGTTTTDQSGVDLLTRWIKEMSVGK
jgi:glucose/arabinose dehydrogenase